MKLKLKPSATISRRYLLIEADGREKVEKAILDYIGVLGWARASPIFVDVKKEKLKGKLVLAIARGEIDNVRAAIEISGEDIVVLRVSGTLKGLGK